MPKTRDKPHLGKKLLEAMALKGVRQVDVADHFDVKPPTVSGDWIKFGRIGKRHFPELVNYFGLSYEWWFGDAEEDKSETPALTKEQKQLLALIAEVDDETRKAFMTLLSKVPKERRKKNVGHNPLRRLDDRTYDHGPDLGTTYDMPSQAEQLKRRGMK